jgi:tricorn protease
MAFISGGNIWTVPAHGGVARLLISHSATESRPHYTPDGRCLAFQSNRSGGTNIFVLAFATVEIKRITFNDGADNLSAWSAHGKWLYFHASYQDARGMNDVFRVNTEGGTPAGSRLSTVRRCGLRLS